MSTKQEIGGNINAAGIQYHLESAELHEAAARLCRLIAADKWTREEFARIERALVEVEADLNHETRWLRKQIRSTKEMREEMDRLLQTVERLTKVVELRTAELLMEEKAGATSH
jgi:hypothetical protein